MVGRLGVGALVVLELSDLIGDQFSSATCDRLLSFSKVVIFRSACKSLRFWPKVSYERLRYSEYRYALSTETLSWADFLATHPGYEPPRPTRRHRRPRRSRL